MHRMGLAAKAVPGMRLAAMAMPGTGVSYGCSWQVVSCYSFAQQGLSC